MGSLYDVLGVRRAATGEELRRAYRLQARTLHPDRHADAAPEERRVTERAMQRLNAAWEVLGDPERRRRYDAECRAGTAPPPRRAHTAGPAGRPSAGYESVVEWMSSWGDVDAADATMGRRRRRPARDHDGDDDSMSPYDDRYDDPDDDIVQSVGVPVWFHRLTVLVIIGVLAALLIGSAFASRVSDSGSPGSPSPGTPAGPVDPDPGLEE